MNTVAGMPHDDEFLRRPSDQEKLQAPSIEELKDEAPRLARSLGRRGVQFLGKRLNKTGLLGALFLWFMRQSADKQRDIVEQGIREYERLLRLPGQGQVAEEN
jgi:hypothetical protein